MPISGLRALAGTLGCYLFGVFSRARIMQYLCSKNKGTAFIMQTLNITFPTCWQELTPAQLRYVYYLLSTNKFSEVEVKTYVLFRWANMEVIAPEGDGYVVKYNGVPTRIYAQQIAELLPHLSWLDRPSPYPVRLPEIDGHKAVDADLQGLSYEAYIICDNLYQGFLHTQDIDLLGAMAASLYKADKKKGIRLQPEEYISIFYWFTSAKAYLARRFTHFFKTAPVTTDTSNIQSELQESMDAQIRALTKGDITKEKEVLQMDVWRALTELDAQVADAEDIKRQLHQS